MKSEISKQRKEQNQTISRWSVELHRKEIIEREKEEERGSEKRIWMEEGKTQYATEVEKVRFEKVEINDIMEKIIEKINDAVAKEILIKLVNRSQ